LSEPGAAAVAVAADARRRGLAGAAAGDAARIPAAAGLADVGVPGLPGGIHDRLRPPRPRRPPSGRGGGPITAQPAATSHHPTPGGRCTRNEGGLAGRLGCPSRVLPLAWFRLFARRARRVGKGWAWLSSNRPR